MRSRSEKGSIYLIDQVSPMLAVGSSLEHTLDHGSCHNFESPIEVPCLDVVDIDAQMGRLPRHEWPGGPVVRLG